MDASEQDPLRADILRELFEMHVLDELVMAANFKTRAALGRSSFTSTTLAGVAGS